jgi:hypothetical protein
MGASFGTRRALERNAIARAEHASTLPAQLPARTRAASPPAVGRPPPGFRLFERRLRDTSFYLVERRKGKLWMYGSIALAAGLWGYIYLFVRFI